MTLYSQIVVYPDGDTQEIERRLRINEIVDLNGAPLALPLPTAKMIAYRVYRVSTSESVGEVVTKYWLELLTAETIMEYVRR